jgi:hypothetical protein
MTSDFDEKLLTALAPFDHAQVFHARGCKCPKFNWLGVEETFERFCREFLPLCPLVDPRGKQVRVLKSNFPKLADLEHATLDRKQFPASRIVECLENGTFHEGDYKASRRERMQMLFWIPEVIANPDAIYKNGHKVVAGDEIYVRVFDKKGSKVKLVFTKNIGSHHEITHAVPITSFLTDARRARQMVKGDPLYLRK